jgi:hypothetical protein
MHLVERKGCVSVACIGCIAASAAEQICVQVLETGLGMLQSDTGDEGSDLLAKIVFRMAFKNLLGQAQRLGCGPTLPGCLQIRNLFAGRRTGPFWLAMWASQCQVRIVWCSVELISDLSAKSGHQFGDSLDVTAPSWLQHAGFT